MPRLNKTVRPWMPATSKQAKVHDTFYDSAAWRRLRRWKLSLNPLCEYCYDKGTTALARIGDHYLPRSMWSELELEPTNLRSCCDQCHQRKRQIEGVTSKDRMIEVLTENGFK